ncbi:MAG: hypothetical protein QOK28_2279 [Actinomycetota bacterium]
MLGAALVAIGAAVGVGSSTGSSRTLPALNRSGDSGNYARDAIGRIAPVDAKFVAARVGKVPGTHATPTTIPGAPRPRATPPPPPVDNSIHGSPGALPGLAPGGFVLGVNMVPSSDTVRANDELRYRMIVTNTGTEEFRGRSFTLEWHTPNGTVGRNALSECDILPAGVMQALCASERLLVSPGLGEARHESFNSGGLVVIPPGGSFTKDWYVQILPTNAAGSTIFNHAHLTVNINGTDHTVRTPDVVVTVVA